MYQSVMASKYMEALGAKWKVWELQDSFLRVSLCAPTFRKMKPFLAASWLKASASSVE